MGNGEAAGDKSPHVAGPARYPVWLVIMLMLVSMSSFLDRVIVATLGPSIKAELGISDTQFGLLTGLAFAFLYSFSAIPIARVADRINRIRLMAVAVSVWSAATVLSGFVGNFVQLALLRVGVGIGEAGTVPCSISIVSDSFPRERRAKALAITALGASAGAALGGFAGGWLGQSVGWRETFVIVGAPGFLIALLLVTTLREPARGRFDPPRELRHARPSLLTVLRTIAAKPAFRHFAFAAGLTSFVNYGIFLFLPIYFGRSFGMSMAEAGFMFGLIGGTSNALGTLIGGLVIDKAVPRDERWYGWFPALAMTVTAPFYLFGLSQSELIVAMPIVGCAAILVFSFYAPTHAAVQNMAEPDMRASAAALLILFQNVIGLGFGPLFVGFMSDFFAQHFFAGGDYAALCGAKQAAALPACASASAAGIRYAMISCAVILFWAALHFWLASRTLRRDLAQ